MLAINLAKEPGATLQRCLLYMGSYVRNLSLKPANPHGYAKWFFRLPGQCANDKENSIGNPEIVSQPGYRNLGTFTLSNPSIHMIRMIMNSLIGYRIVIRFIRSVFIIHGLGFPIKRLVLGNVNFCEQFPNETLQAMIYQRVRASPFICKKNNRV